MTTDLRASCASLAGPAPAGSLLQLLVEMIKDCFEAEDVWVLLHDAATGELCPTVAAPAAAERLKRVRVASGRGVAASVFERGTPLLVEDTATDPHFCPDEDQLSAARARSLIAIPLLAPGNRCAGILEVVNHRSGEALTQAQLKRLVRVQIPLSRAVDAACRARLDDGLAHRDFYAAQLQLLNFQARTVANQDGVLAAQQAQFERERQQLLREARIKGLGHFVAGLSHELNNPLGFATSNLSSLEAILDDVAQALDPALAQGECGALVEDAAQCARETQVGLLRMADVIRSLNTFGNLSLQGRESVDLCEVVRQATAQVQAQHPGRQIDCRLGTVPALTASFEHLVQATVALLDNAVKNSTEAHPVQVDLACSGGEILLAVRDQGRGLAPECLEHLYEPFATDKRADWRGTGLGLAAVHGIVLAHGGRVEVVSAVGIGTTFMICLPCSDSAADLAASAGSERAPCNADQETAA